MSWIKLNYASFTLSFLILFVGVFHIGFPIFLDIFISLILATILNSWASSLITVATLLIGYVAVNLTYDIQINYRAHEMLASKGNIYSKNEKITIQQPYGDLFAMSQNDPAYKQIIEPREILFITDDRGYRNRKTVVPPDLILIGDSFIVGNGTTQNEILSEQLSRKTGLQVYSLSHPGGPQEYENYVRKNYDLLSDKKNLLLFYFEGNDFTFPINNYELLNNYEVSNQNIFLTVKGYILKMENMKSNYFSIVYPLSFKLVRLVNRKSRTSYFYISNFFLGPQLTNEYERTVVKQLIGKKEVGFLSKYIKISTWTEDLSTYIWIEKEYLSKVKAVVFIPTKYRVYNSLDENKPLEILQKSYSEKSIPVIDLTKALRDASKDYLSLGDYVYWRDDTHWNANGIRVAADFISENIK